MARQARVLQRQEALAHEQAARVLVRAREQAQALVDCAEREAASILLRAEEEGRANAAATVAAQAVALAAREAAADERALDRTVELAQALAERLLGEALRLAPTRVSALAREALREARGARQIQLFAHTDDAAVLTTCIDALGVDPSIVRIDADPSLARGNLRLVTDIGVLDADLAVELERLALKLRETLADERT
jgi:flagellar biosynthesis/type III secretory pathway protein FliH